MSPSPILVEISSYELQKCLNRSETFTNRSEIQIYVSLVLENFSELHLSSEISHFAFFGFVMQFRAVQRLAFGNKLKSGFELHLNENF